jgi:hypothetical protein
MEGFKSPDFISSATLLPSCVGLGQGCDGIRREVVRGGCCGASCLGLNPGPTFITCVTLAKKPNLFVAAFCHL